MSNVIYVDILLMINLLVNFLMLSAAGLLVKTPTRSWRILLSAAMRFYALFPAIGRFHSSQISSLSSTSVCCRFVP